MTPQREIKVVKISAVVAILALLLFFGFSTFAAWDWTNSDEFTFSPIAGKPTEEMADILASDVFGNGEKQELFKKYLLWLNEHVDHSNIIIVYNSGGWGQDSLFKDGEYFPEEINERERGIVEGIEQTLMDWGYNPAVVDYVRTEGNLLGYFKEAIEMRGGYPTKAKELAAMALFLTELEHQPKVILFGECTAAEYVNEAMKILEYNGVENVYSIQICLPFWYKDRDAPPAGGERSLLVNTNINKKTGEEIPDSFHEGDFFTIIHEGFANSPQKTGSIEIAEGHWYLGAPGHDYFWDDDDESEFQGVKHRIEPFLESHFLSLVKSGVS